MPPVGDGWQQWAVSRPSEAAIKSFRLHLHEAVDEVIAAHTATTTNGTNPSFTAPRINTSAICDLISSAAWGIGAEGVLEYASSREGGDDEGMEAEGMEEGMAEVEMEQEMEEEGKADYGSDDPLELLAVGGLYHLYGTGLMHAAAKSANCTQVTSTLWLLAETTGYSSSYYYAPLHGAVWHTLVTATAPHLASPPYPSHDGSRGLLAPSVATHFWDYALRLCAPLARRRDSRTILTHCSHGVGHAASLLTATIADRFRYDRCSPPRLCSVPRGRAALESAIALCQAAPASGLVHMCSQGVFMDFFESSTPASLGQWSRPKSGTGAAGVPPPPGWVGLCAAHGSLATWCFSRVFVAGIDNIPRDDAAIMETAPIKDLREHRLPTPQAWSSLVWGLCGRWARAEGDADAGELVHRGCLAGIAWALCEPVQYFTQKAQEEAPSGTSPPAAAIVQLCDTLAGGEVGWHQQRGDVRAVGWHRFLACVAATAQKLTLEPPGEKHSLAEEAAGACSPLEEAQGLELNERAEALALCVATLRACTPTSLWGGAHQGNRGLYAAGDGESGGGGMYSHIRDNDCLFGAGAGALESAPRPSGKRMAILEAVGDNATPSSTALDP
jgi:hypothetical protein